MRQESPHLLSCGVCVCVCVCVCMCVCVCVTIIENFESEDVVEVRRKGKRERMYIRVLKYEILTFLDSLCNAYIE